MFHLVPKLRVGTQVFEAPLRRLYIDEPCAGRQATIDTCIHLKLRDIREQHREKLSDSMESTPLPIRRQIVQRAKTFVVKVGSNVLSDAADQIDPARIASLCEQIIQLRSAGKQVVLVSSGAIGTGMSLLKLNKRPKDLPHLQAAAATGQAHLIHLYDVCFRKHGYHAAQLLLTANDIKRRHRYLNMRNTLYTLFEYNVIPIVNENDTVSIEEIKFGDNDQLAAMVSHLLPNPLLVILSVIDGLYDGDPAHPKSQVIPLIDQWDDRLHDLVTETKSSRGTGGMASKLDAVRMATAVGIPAIIANGTHPGILQEILQGDDVGTLFLAKETAIPAIKRWIGFTVKPKGTFIIDQGACEAILVAGKSLLPIGIIKVNGEFAEGEVVSICNEKGTEIARGLSNYDASDAQQIARKKTSEIPKILGTLPYAEVVHRNNLVVLG
ncbi:MAG: glutamate 5-kinase [Planctomycetaceae bacterium]